jgi:hypothetical protein
MILVVKSIGKVPSGRLRKDVNDSCSEVGREGIIQCNARMSVNQKKWLKVMSFG